MANLALKYRPKTFEDVTEQKNVVNILKSMCEQPELPNRNFLLIGPRGCGKAQPLYSKVLTSNGYISMGDVEVGMEVFTGKGNVAHIESIHPQGVRDIYSILLDDNTSIEVSDEHLNEVWIRDVESNEIVHETLTTLELKMLFDKYQSEDIYFNRIGIDLPRVDWFERPVSFEISKDLVLQIFEKFEPVYFYNSVKNRVGLLKLLLLHMYGTDVVNWQRLADNFTVFVDQTSARVSASLSFLVQSLGCKDTVTVKVHENVPVFEHNIQCPVDIHEMLFGEVDSHVDRDPVRFIKSINLVGCTTCQCIMLDHEDHTYISDNFIPTHNTTLGRIVANKLNDGEGKPIEIDGASHSGVDTIRDVVQQAHLYPIGCKYKVFIIDECHAISNQGWQSLLLTLEEQPAKSVFILLTTNPEKIPATIISRVQVFQISNISLAGIESRLKYVIEQENKDGRNITYEDDAISYLAKLAKGGMRDSLTLLDKALVYSNELTSLNLKEALNIPEYDDYFNLLNAYAKKDNAKIMMIVNNVYNSGVNFVKWFEGFQSFVINIAKYVFVQDINKTMIPSYYVDKLTSYNEKHAQICLSLSQVLVDLIARISRTEYMEEVALSYLCQRR